MPQSMATERLFLDTNVLVAGSFVLQPDFQVVFNHRASKFANEYVVKEFRHVLTKKGAKPHDIENALEQIRKNVKILPSPQKHEFEKIMLTDKSDRPIVCSALKSNCTLVTNDDRTYREAKKYVAVKSPKEVLQG